MQGRIEQFFEGDASRLRVAVRSLDQHPSARAAYRRLYRCVAVTDTLAIASALLLGYWARFSFRLPSKDFLLLVLGAPFAVVGMFAAFRLYDAYRFTPAEEFRRIILAVSLGLTGLVTLSFWSHAEFSREWLALSWVLALLFALGSRRIWHSWTGKLRARGKLAFATLIVGSANLPPKPDKRLLAAVELPVAEALFGILRDSVPSRTLRDHSHDYPYREGTLSPQLPVRVRHVRRLLFTIPSYAYLEPRFLAAGDPFRAG